jgi:hypothetical protein
VNRGHPMKMKKGLRSQLSDPIREGDQRPTGIARNQVAWDLIPQGGPAIQTMVSLSGLHVSVRRIAG